MALACGAPACGLEREYDEYPIRFERAGGALLAAADVGAGPVPVVVDILTPVSAIELDGEAAVHRVRVDLMLHALTAGGGTVARSRVLDLPLLDTAPCAAPPCLIGLTGAGRAITGVVGADVLAATGRAARFDFVRGELSFLPGIAGDDIDRGLECEAVMRGAFAGGGTLLVDGAEVGYAGRRPTLGACLVDDGGLEESGTDVLLALSTGLGQSVLSESAWDRLAFAEGLPAARALPRGELLLPDGPTPVGRGTVPQISLIGDLGSASEKRGPCRELLANRLMARSGDRGCGLLAPGQPCPCKPDAGQVCDAAAAALLHRPLAVAVVPDSHPLLQSLRDELRPDLPELDGILAADALAALRIDFDYPHDRLLLRCLDADLCTIRPAVLDEVRPVRSRCLPIPPDGGLLDDELLP